MTKGKEEDKDTEEEEEQEEEGEEEETVHMSRALVRRVISHAKPFKKHILGTVVLAILRSVIELASPLIVRDLVDNALPQKQAWRVTVLCAAMFLTTMLSMGAFVANRFLSATIGQGVILNLRIALVSHLQELGVGFFVNTKAGELMSRIQNDVEHAQQAFTETLLDVLSYAFEVIAAAVLMATLDWRLAMIGLVTVPLSVITVRKTTKRIERHTRQTMDAMAAMTTGLNETISIGGVLVSRLFGRRDEEISQFRKRADQVREMEVRSTVTEAAINGVLCLISTVGSTGVYALGGFLVLRGDITVGTVVAIVDLHQQFSWDVRDLADAPVMISKAFVSFERVFEVLDLPVEIVTPENPITLDSVRGEIQFQSVTLRHSIPEGSLLRSAKSRVRRPCNSAGDGEVALDHVSFTVQPGQLVALVSTFFPPPFRQPLPNGP